MSICLKLRLACLFGFTAIFCSGCIVRRTVEEDGVVVAKGYAITGPLLIDNPNNR